MKYSSVLLIPVMLLIMLVIPQLACVENEADQGDAPPLGIGPDEFDLDDDSVDEDDDSADDDFLDDDDDTTSKEVPVTVDYIYLDGSVSPPNPITGDVTPPEYNKIMLLRYRQDTGDDPPRPVKAIFLYVMGWGAGASQIGLMAHDLIVMSKGEVEVWSVDRRTNLLEDTWGMDVASAQKDPKIAYDYYFEGLPVNGRVFAGWVDAYSPKLAMISEWGVDIAFEGIREIINQIPEENRKTNLFMGGHSQGARTVKMYAAYQFPDGRLGNDDIGGLILWDSLDQQSGLNISEYEYQEYILAVRDGTLARYKNQDFFWGETSTVFMLQYFAMASAEGFGDGNPEYGPNGFLSEWPGLIGLAYLLMCRFRNIKMTNEAFVGLLIDDESGLSNDFMAHVGRITGGETGRDLLGVYPKDPNATYTWKHFDKTIPEETTDLTRVIKLLYETPTNITDTYNSARLLYEHFIADDIESEGTWVHNYFHYYTSLIDVPVFCLEGHFSANSGTYEKYRDKLPPVAGQDLPRTEVGFDIFQAHDWSHMEVIFVERDRNPAYAALLNWADTWSTGTVQVPHFGTTIPPGD